MRTVLFPGLGLSFEIDRVAFRLPFVDLPIYWYGLIIAAGFIVAILVCCKLAPKVGIKAEQLTDFILFAVPISIIGARLYYIIFYLDLFRNESGGLDLLKMLSIRDGGLAIYGGIIAGLITLIVFCKIKKLNFFAFADCMAFGLLIGQSAGRWGNFVNVEAYGGPTDLPWRMGIEGFVEATGTWEYMEVHPTFLYESLWNVVGLVILYIIFKKCRKFDGELMFFYFGWYGVGRGFIEGLRTDSLYFFNTGIRVSQVLGYVSGIVAFGILLYVLLAKKPKPEDLYVNRLKAAAAKDETAAETVEDTAEETAPLETAADGEEEKEAGDGDPD